MPLSRDAALSQARINGRVYAIGAGKDVFRWARNLHIGGDVLAWMTQPRVLESGECLFAINATPGVSAQLKRYSEQFDIPVYEVTHDSPAPVG